MKALVLREWLSSHADILERSGGADAAGGLRRLTEVLAARSQSNVKAICDILDKLAPTYVGGEKVAPTADLLRRLVAASSMLAKAADSTDLKRFAASVERCSSSTLDEFVMRAREALTPQTQPVRPASLSENDLRGYLKKLEEALGDERGFEVVYQKISTDGRIKAPDAKKLAKAFTGKAGQSKTDALGLIYKRHKNLMGAQPKADATGRRLAG